MPFDAWLPLGYQLPDGLSIRRPVAEGESWQIWEAQEKTRVLIVRARLFDRWCAEGIVGASALKAFDYGPEKLFMLPSGPGHMLVAVAESRSPNSKVEAIEFASSLKTTRATGTPASFHDAIYAERVSRLLPTYTLTPPVEDRVVLGTWLTGGVPVSTSAVRRMRSLTNWLGAKGLDDVTDAAGFGKATEGTIVDDESSSPAGAMRPQFQLAGRPGLEAFFREHVIDIVDNAERYRALGIDFPSAVVLHGPPGCGKTFAVERLVEHLGWPSFSIDASSIGSPYIHETSRKVAAVFDEAMKSSPSVLVIDEMEAFLADREMGAESSHHRVEEVGEFLRRIPEAIKNHVLVVAMTNRLEMIDSAILRRGRFDHVIEVGMASREEVQSLLGKLVGELPSAGDVDVAELALQLKGRPLSDVAFVVREGARLAARSGKSAIDATSLMMALERTPARGAEAEKRGIGFLSS
jgi:hypothetical protein